MTIDQSAPDFSPDNLRSALCTLHSQISNLKSSDVIVVGAGPAGTSASILLAQRGVNVLLLEKSRFPREKLCGEFLSPETLRLFERLGVRERMMEAGAQVIRKWVLVAPGGRRVEIPLKWLSDGGEAIGLSRARMDQILLERARECGVTVREGFHVSPRLAREGELTLIEGRAVGGEAEHFSAHLLIDASGRNRLFAGTAQRTNRRSGSRCFGVKVHLRGVEGLGDTGELYFFRDGYGGMSAVEGGRTNLCFITTEETLRAAKGDRHALLEMTMMTSPAARERLRGAVTDGEWLGTGPLEYGRRPSVPGVLAIGDAGAFIDPFTGSGMLLAMMSGELAAEVISDSFARGEQSVELIASRCQEMHRKRYGWRFRACAMLRNLAFKPAARSLLALLLERHSALARAVALSTRQ
ncbi:MAG TPA: NAD(P)/FAD-dependent oxidoreductase [Blastocatellia bacterium]|nr:NAD(P)/FAD-dependent oxidoreductase [Blastocatellia bacterium]